MAGIDTPTPPPADPSAEAAADRAGLRGTWTAGEDTIDRAVLEPVTAILGRAIAGLHMADPADTRAVISAALSGLRLAASVGRLLADTGPLDYQFRYRNAATGFVAAEIALGAAAGPGADVPAGILAVDLSPRQRLSGGDVLALHGGVLAAGSACNIVGAAAQRHAVDGTDLQACKVITAVGYETWMSYDGDYPELWGGSREQHAIAGFHPHTMAYLDAVPYAD